MKRTLTFFLLFMKRLLKKPSFVLILLMMPLLVLAFRLVLKADSSTVNIALFSYDKDENITDSLNELCAKKGQMHFYIEESERSLKEAVLTNSAECGFVISEGFYDALMHEKAEDMICIYRNTKTTLDDLTKEMLFRYIFEHYAYDRALKYVEDQGFYEKTGVSKEEFEKNTAALYEGYMKDGGIFEVIYSGGGTEEKVDIEKETSGTAYLMRPVRGILALFMMIAALAGAVFRAIDEKQGVYKTLGHEERPYINLLTAFIPAFLAGLAALLGLYLGGVAKGLESSGTSMKGAAPGSALAVTAGFFAELAGLFVYTLLLTGFANLLRSLIKNEAMLASILPMLTVVSLLGCNIFFNTAAMVTGIKQLRLILPPNYFLEYTGTITGGLITTALAIALCIAGVVADRRKNA